jgi:hypothetical protein
MTRSRVIVEFPDRPAYAVRIGGGLAARLGADSRSAGISAERSLVICDADSAERCLPPLRDSLAASGLRVSDIAVPTVDPDDAWACIAELHRAFAQLALSEEAPIIVCAGVQVAELAAFAVSVYGGANPLVIVPASCASALRTLAVDAFEPDVGLPVPVVAPARPVFAVADTALLACASGEERELGFEELDIAAGYADADFRSWQDAHREQIAALDEDALVLALTQTLAARADAIGKGLLR